MAFIDAALRFTETVQFGAILVAVFGVGLAVFWTVRSNVASYWRDVASAEQERVKQLLERIGGMVPRQQLEQAVAERDKQRALKHEAISEAAALRLTRDLTPLIRAHQTLMERLVAMQEEGEARYGIAIGEVRAMFAEHEARAQARQDEQIKVLRAIADKLQS